MQISWRADEAVAVAVAEVEDGEAAVGVEEVVVDMSPERCSDTGLSLGNTGQI